MSRPVSGIFASFEAGVFGPVYRMWVEEINAAGGIYVAEYERQLPIEIIRFDDESNLDNMLRNTERLILEEQVDFIFPACSTGHIFAQAQLTNDYGYLLFSAEGGAVQLSQQFDELPLFFVSNNHAGSQIPELTQILVELGVTSVFIVYINDLFGSEYVELSVPNFRQAGIAINGMTAIPRNHTEFGPIFSQFNSSGAQAYLQFAYNGENFPMINQAAATGFNPDLMLFGPGVNTDGFISAIGGDVALTEGVMGFAGFNRGSNPDAARYVDQLTARFIFEGQPVNIDWWGHLPYYTMLQVFGQAVEAAGTLDNARVAEVMRNHSFPGTVMGTVHIVNNQIAADVYLGQIGQWQNGIYEVIDTTRHRTAAPIFPKPAWP